MKTIIVNGANGYVASNFINELVKKKYRVIALVRGNNKFTPEKRMEDVLNEINNNVSIDLSGLKVYNYSLLDNNFALAEEELRQIFSGETDYFHFAASLKYDGKSVDEIFSTNIEGVKNSIRVFLKYASKSSRFFYIGTVYSCGRLNEVFKEDFYENANIYAFRNYYEQSKRFAENVVKENIEKNKLNAHIIRLSQVIGSQKTCISITDYGIFDFAKRVYGLAYRYPNEVVRIHVDPDSTQNLIPVDTVTNHLTEVVEKSNAPDIMNFVSNKSISNSHIIETLNRIIPIRLIPLKKLERISMNPIERLVAVGMSFTESYALANISFDAQKRDHFLNYPETGPDDDSVAKMLQNFIEELQQKRSNKKSIPA